MHRRIWWVRLVLVCLAGVLCTDVCQALIVKRRDTNIPTRAVMVQRGDTLRVLAALHLGDADRWKEFLKVNRFTNPNVLTPGEKLHVPVYGQPTTQPSPPKQKPQTATVVRTGVVPARIQWRVNESSLSIGQPQALVVRVEDASGVPVPNARVEWTLNTGAGMVGDIMDAGVASGSRHPVGAGKRTNAFAITHTQSQPEALGIGTAGTTDIGVGETWILVLATVPGNMDVTVFCPSVPRQFDYHSTQRFVWTEALIGMSQPLDEPTQVPTWEESAPQLVLDGPASLGLLEQGDYTLRIGNIGDRTFMGLTLAVSIPKQGLSFLTASDDAQLMDGELFWELPRLEPNASAHRQLQLQAVETGEWQIRASVSDSDNLQTQATKPVLVDRPQLQLG